MIIFIIIVQDSDQWNQKLSIRKSATPWKWLSQLMVIGHGHYFNLTHPILLIHEAGSSKTTKIKIGLQHPLYEHALYLVYPGTATSPFNHSPHIYKCLTQIYVRIKTLIYYLTLFYFIILY